MRKNFKKLIILISLIEIFGLCIIFLQTKIEINRILRDRENYYIVVDTNNKDVLKIDRKYLSSNELNRIKITKSGNDKKYIIEDKRLIDDIIAKIDFKNFISNPNLNMISEDLKISFEGNNNIFSISLSQEDKIAFLKYNDSSFLVTVSDEFYNFIYDLFSKIV